ncbi:uncharacterized protein G2W53_010680 [Senna tora]|uniref:BED-type domain-containing protein n=1 Tax=Senna tora TaxID=362788 RepID=A0A834X0B1_9FABA|nr:uncharacterized protein G2W53_010680 [Senna tora]
MGMMSATMHTSRRWLEQTSQAGLDVNDDINFSEVRTEQGQEAFSLSMKRRRANVDREKFVDALKDLRKMIDLLINSVTDKLCDKLCASVDRTVNDSVLIAEELRKLAGLTALDLRRAHKELTSSQIQWMMFKDVLDEVAGAEQRSKKKWPTNSSPAIFSIFDFLGSCHCRGSRQPALSLKRRSNASNANASTPPSGQQSITDSSTLSQHGKTDPAWDHFSFKKEGRTNVYTCLHCLSVYKGGGINRIKQHLAGVTGQITSCKKVPHDVRHQMLESLKNVQQKKQTEELNEAYDDQQEAEESPQPSKRVAFTQALGITFVKSVDASDLVKDAQMLFNSFSEVIEWVAPSNVVHIVTDNAANYVAAVKIVAPIVHLLRIVDADEKPSMGYVYEGMRRAKKKMKEMFKGKKQMYKPYKDIIKARWHKHFRCDLYAAAYYFNLAFFYDEKFVEKNNITQAVLCLLEIRSICNDLAKGIQEMQVYYDRKGSFGRESARTVTRTIRLDQWWRLYGGSAPFLQKIAIRVLSQTASSSGCERNWSFFERVHTKKRNRLEHQRLSDHIFITYNLRLANRCKKKNYDPIDYESIDEVDFWITEEAPPDFDDQEFDNENVIYQEHAFPAESSR